MPSGRQTRPLSLCDSKLIASVVIVLAVALAYARSLHVPFFFDDQPGIVRNPSLHTFWPPSAALHPPVTAAGAAGRPITNVSLALNYAAGGLDPAGYHVFNIAVHAAVALLLFAVTRRTLKRLNRGRPRSNFCAAAIALVWAVHPLTTEAVVCTIQRNELLAAFFLLLTLYAFIRSVEARSPFAWWAGAVGACLLGMGSKETMVGAPLLVLLYDRTFVAGSFRAALRSRALLYAALAATWLWLADLAMGNQQRAGTVGFALGTSSWDYLVTQAHAVALYLKLSMWPHPLVVDYGFTLAPGLGAVWPEALLVLALLAATALALWRAWAWAFPAAAFFLLLGPSSSILPLTTQTMAEHRMYLPLAAVVALLVCGATALLRRGFWFVGLAAVALLLLTQRRVATYQSERAIWTDTVAKQPENARAWSSLGRVLVGEDRWADAAACYGKALALRPDYADTQNDAANVLMHLGRVDDALAHYRAAHRLKPADNDIEYDLALALAQTGDLNSAIEHLSAVVKRDPANTRALNNLGDALLRENRVAAALNAFNAAVTLEPASPAAHNNAAVALMRLGRYGEAVPHYEAALRSWAGSALIHHNLALALHGAGRLGESVQQEEEALKLEPGMTRAQEHLAELRARLGK